MVRLYGQRERFKKEGNKKRTPILRLKINFLRDVMKKDILENDKKSHDILNAKGECRNSVP